MPNIGDDLKKNKNNNNNKLWLLLLFIHVKLWRFRVSHMCVTFIYFTFTLLRVLYTRGLMPPACICYLQNFQHMKTLFKSSFPLVWKRLRLFNSYPGKSNMKQISYQDKDPEPQMAPADNKK